MDLHWHLLVGKFLIRMKKTKKTKDKKNYVWAGLAGAFTATTCCIAPVVLVLLGFGTAFSMMIMHQFHIISIVSGVILVLLVSLIIVKRKSGVCNIKTMSQNWKVFPLAIIFLVLSWAFINYLIVAPVAGMVYGNLEVEKKPLGNIKEMAEEMSMPKMADVEIVPEMEGEKLLVLEIEGIYCGSCGPAISYDIESILGVLWVEQSGSIISVTYDSDITSKDVIIATIHDPYSAKIISEEKIVV